jgi:hypothetical protein
MSSLRNPSHMHWKIRHRYRIQGGMGGCSQLSIIFGKHKILIYKGIQMHLYKLYKKKKKLQGKHPRSPNNCFSAISNPPTLTWVDHLQKSLNYPTWNLDMYSTRSNFMCDPPPL